MSVVVDDEFLSAHMPRFEELMLDQIPPERELSHRFSGRFNRNMQALLRYERRTPRMRKFVSRMKAAAAIFAVVLALTVGALMSVEACRTRIIEIMTRVLSDATSLRISVNDGAPSDRVLSPISPTYVSEGYHVVEEETSSFSNEIIYMNEKKVYLVYTQDVLTASENLFDTEDAEVTTTHIGTREVTVIEKESGNTCQIYWYDNYYFYWLSGDDIDVSEIIKMAESIILR